MDSGISQLDKGAHIASLQANTNFLPDKLSHSPNPEVVLSTDPCSAVPEVHKRKGLIFLVGPLFLRGLCLDPQNA